MTGRTFMFSGGSEQLAHNTDDLHERWTLRTEGDDELTNAVAALVARFGIQAVKTVVGGVVEKQQAPPTVKRATALPPLLHTLNLDATTCGILRRKRIVELDQLLPVAHGRQHVRGIGKTRRQKIVDALFREGFLGNVEDAA